MNIFIFILGIFWATLVEWLLHRYVLHDLAARLKAGFHLEHHITSARNKGKDSDYDDLFFKSRPRMKEIGALFLISLLHSPFILIPEFFIGTMCIVFLYYFAHYTSHKNPEFGWRWFPWHMEHHLVSAKKNFGVTTPFWDWAFGTGLVYRK